MTKKRAKRRLLAATALIFLSLNAQVTDDSGRTFLTTIPPLRVPLSAGPAWRLARLFNRLLQVVAGLYARVAGWKTAASRRFASAWETARLVGAMAGIGLKSSLYGLGVEL